MALIVYPGSDEKRITTLSTSEKTAISEDAAGNGILSNRLMKLISDVLPPMQEAMKSLSNASAVRAREVSEKNSSLAIANTYLRDYWIAIRNRVNRENLPTSVLKYYGLPLSGILPTTNPNASVLSFAETAIAGDEQAVAAGYNPMSNPSAEELRVVVDAARKELDDVAGADQSVDSNEKALAELREKADFAIREVVAELRFFLRMEDDSNQRRIMRNYGLTFKSETESAAE